MTNCVYIFRDGFDMQMGMPTGYPDFLKYYDSLDSSTENVASIKRHFLLEVAKKKEKEEHWKDLEVALGLFTKEVSDVVLFIDFYRDISHALNSYLTLVEKNVPYITDEDRNKFWEDLKMPENYLHLDFQKNKFKTHVSKKEVIADIVTFNYTSTLERFLSAHWDSKGYFSDSLNSDTFKIRSIKHIHGILNETDLLFGVNDLTQVDNKTFCENENFLDLVIKPKRNQELGTNVDLECISLIQEADIFYIYGTSLGPTDQYWWDLIGSRFIINPNTIILYFDYNQQELKKGMLKTEYISLEREVRKQIMKAMGVTGEENNYRQRIYVVRNSTIFPTFPRRTQLLNDFDQQVI